MGSHEFRSAVRLALVVGILLAPRAFAEDAVEWDQERVKTLAADLHEGVKGIYQESRAVPRGVGTMDAWAYDRLLDELRLIERETGHLHSALASGAGREETQPTYARIAILRRDCAEEMQKQFIGTTALDRLERTHAIVKQLDPYYGFDPEREDHERVFERARPR